MQEVNNVNSTRKFINQNLSLDISTIQTVLSPILNHTRDCSGKIEFQNIFLFFSAAYFLTKLPKV